MEKADAQYAQAKLAQLKGKYQVDVPCGLGRW